MEGVPKPLLSQIQESFNVIRAWNEKEDRIHCIHYNVGASTLCYLEVILSNSTSTLKQILKIFKLKALQMKKFLSTKCSVIANSPVFSSPASSDSSEFLNNFQKCMVAKGSNLQNVLQSDIVNTMERNLVEYEKAVEAFKKKSKTLNLKYSEAKKKRGDSFKELSVSLSEIVTRILTGKTLEADYYVVESEYRYFAQEFYKQQTQFNTFIIESFMSALEMERIRMALIIKCYEKYIESSLKIYCGDEETNAIQVFIQEYSIENYIKETFDLEKILKKEEFSYLMKKNNCEKLTIDVLGIYFENYKLKELEPIQSGKSEFKVLKKSNIFGSNNLNFCFLVFTSQRNLLVYLSDDRMNRRKAEKITGIKHLTFKPFPAKLEMEIREAKEGFLCIGNSSTIVYSLPDEESFSQFYKMIEKVKVFS